MKYLIVGLGNIGDGYRDTRHNIGFTVLDAMAEASNTSFMDGRYGFTCRIKYKGRDLILLKPSTFMNLSGNAVSYWLKKENIPVENMLVIVDDLALPLGSIRMRHKGSDGGHNGLAHINSVLGTNEYPSANVDLNKLLEEARTKISDLEKQLADAGIDKLNKRIAELENQLGDARSEITTHKGTIDSLNKMISDITTPAKGEGDAAPAGPGTAPAGPATTEKKKGDK